MYKLSSMMILGFIFSHLFSAEPPTKVQRIYDAKKTAKLQKEFDTRQNFARMNQLVKEGASPSLKNKRGLSLLWKAVLYNQLTLSITALENGADSNEIFNNLKWTPLMHPSSAALVSSLIIHGGNVHHRDRAKNTPLHHHAGNPYTTTGDTIALLCDAGADQNAQDGQGNTAAHLLYSSKKMWKEKVAALYFAEADTTIQNEAGETPLDTIKHNKKRVALVQDTLRKAEAFKVLKADEIIGAHTPFPSPVNFLVMSYAGGLWSYCKPEIITAITTKTGVKKIKVTPSASSSAKKENKNFTSVTYLG